MARGETAVWAVEGLPLKIEYAGGVLEEIRAAALAGFYRFPRGGLEVGGLLFGVAEAETVRILAARPVACEYLYGPSYALSEKDEVLLRRMLHAPAVDPSLQGLQAVGWYHSHTRSGIFLSEQDLKIHSRYFPRYWHVALVVRPQPYGSTRAGFFVREADGTLRTESSYLEFDIPEAPAGGREAAIAEQPEPAPAATSEPPVLPPPAEPNPPAPRRKSGLKWALGVLALALLAAVAFLMPHGNGPASTPPSLSLRAANQDGAVVDLAWDPAAAPIRAASRALLEIHDGADQVELPLDRNSLLEGRFSYVRHSEDVDVRLKVYSRDGIPAEESIHLLGKPPAPRPNPAATEVGQIPKLPSLEERPLPPATSAPEPRTDSQPVRQAEPAPRQVAPRRFSLAQLQRRADGRNVVAALPAPPLSAGTAITADLPPGVLEPAGGAPPPPRPVRPPAAKPAASGPRAGRLIWTGQLRKGAELAIDGENASFGVLNGRLPGMPVHVVAHPAELASRGLEVYLYNPASARREPAGPENGWNDTFFEWDPQHAAALKMEESPNTGNHWSRLVVRARKAVSVIVIEWQLLDIPRS